MRGKNLLIIFIRNPELGKVKSRLANSIGKEKALLIYEELLKHTRHITSELQLDKRIYYSENISNTDFWDSSCYEKRLQSDGDLGQKMLSAFEEGFSSGYENVIIIGSDIYDLKNSHIESAFECLLSSDTVIGPSEDGGYYLLGMNTLIPVLFESKPWGTEQVLELTIKDLIENYSVSYLEELNDIDVISDIKSDSNLYKYV